MKVVLELLDQPSNIRRITVRHDIVIGRGADCNLRLSAPQVSRRHCFLRISSEAASVTDLDSSNGTYINGKRIESGKRFDLSDGTTLSLGPIRFVVRVRQEVVSDEVLRDSQVDDSIATDASVTGRSSSTIIEGKESGGTPAASRPMKFSVEQGGPSSSSNESTADFSHSIAPSVPGRSDDDQDFLPAVDSLSEIVDLGRLVENADSPPAEGPGSRSRPTRSTAAARSAGTDEAFASVEIAHDIPVDFADVESGHEEIVDVLDGEVHVVVDDTPVDVLEDAPVVEVIDDVADVLEHDIVDVLEHDIVDVIDDGQIEIVDEEVEVVDEVEIIEIDAVTAADDSSGNWFEDADLSASSDDDDDEELRKFLRG